MTVHNRLRLLNVSIDNCLLASTLDDIEAAVSTDPRGPAVQFAFVNADCLNRAWRDPSYTALLNRLPRVYADGSGIRWALRLIHSKRLLDNVNGTDLFPLLCQRAERAGWRLALLGATTPVMQQLVRNLANTYPELQVVFAGDGYFAQQSEAETIAAIAESRPDVLLVGMGAPRQEFWIDAHLDQLNASVAIGVGGLFDFYSESVRRAPMIFRRCGMEWVWRLAQEPGRLWQRYLVGNPIFIGRAVRNRKRDGVLLPGS